MQKKLKSVIIAAGTVLCIACGIFCGCQREDAIYYTIKYGIQSGGYLVGEAEQEVRESAVGSSVTAVPHAGYKFVSWSDGVTTSERTDTPSDHLSVDAVFEIDALGLPVMQITTQDNEEVTSKEEYLNCTVSVENAEEAYCFSDYSAKIRGRGNTTWQMPKKPYKLKFDSKVDLFGNGNAKTWVLIANYADPSLMRNYLAYTLGASLGDIADTTTTVQFVDVYFNGRYDGVYLVCEQNEVGKTRVNIEDDFNKAPNPEDMGFLLELDGHAPDEGEEDLDYIVLNDIDYAIKSPDYEDLTETKDFAVYANYIKNYLSEAWSALQSGDIEEVKKYFDLPSFADSYIVHELFNCKDVGQSSFYIYKKEGGKLYCGPLWDFDLSAGNCNFNDTAYQEKESKDPNCLWAKELNVWYNALLGYSEFKGLVSARLKGNEEKILSVIDEAIEYAYERSEAFERNFERWQTLGQPVWPNPEEMIAITTWKGQVEYLREWLGESLEYMLSVYCPEVT